MSHPRIKLIGTTMMHENMRHVNADFNRDALAKVISTLIIAGFNEESLPDKTMSRMVESVMDLGELLGREINMDAKYNVLARMRPVMGLLYIANIAQAAAFGLLSRDPVASLAMADTWNGLHSNIVSSEELSEEQHDRLLSLLDIDGEGVDAVEYVEKRLEAYSATGCACGRNHDAEEADDEPVSSSAKEQVSSMSADELLSDLPLELRSMIGLIAAASGRGESAIVEAIRTAFLEDRDPSEILVSLLSGKDSEPPKPELGSVHVPGSIELELTDDPVEKIYQASIPAMNQEYQRKFGKDLSKAQLTNIRQQLEEQRAAIEAGVARNDGALQAVTLKVPRE